MSRVFGQKNHSDGFPKKEAHENHFYQNPAVLSALVP
jgi:hypothetical protein